MARGVRGAAAAALACWACGPQLPPQKPLPPPPPPSALDLTAGAGEDASAVLYVYSPVGKRDPFRDTLAAGGRVAVGPDTRGVKPTRLQKYEIDQLRLQFTQTGTSAPAAMIIDPSGRGTVVRVGDFIGKNWGKISHIGREEITVTETIADQQTGRVYPNYVQLRMPVTDVEKRTKDLLDEDEANP